MRKPQWELGPVRGLLAGAAMVLAVLEGIGPGPAGGQTLTKTGTVTSGPDTGSTTQAANGETGVRRGRGSA